MKHVSRVAALVVLCCSLLVGCSTAANDTRHEFLSVIDRPHVPLDARADDATHFSFAADAQQRVPGILTKPSGATGRLPAVIVLHGTGGTKEGEQPLLNELAAHGFLAVAIDGRHHGARTKAGKGTAEYEEAIVRAWRDPGHEHPLYYDTVWDVMRLVDYLQARDDVDPNRIGLIGFSKGGIETYFAAAADERIAVAVPCIGVQSFRWALDNDAWKGRIGTIQGAFDTIAKEAGVAHPDAAFVQSFYDRVVPGIADRFDGPSMLTLIAPRPLMVINGESDDHTPLPGVLLCQRAAEQAYREAGAEDRSGFRIELHTAHKVNDDSRVAAIEFFVRWLKAQPPTTRQAP